MKLVLDEMYSPKIGRKLRDLGHDVISVKDRLDLVSSSDPDLVSLMTAEDRAIVTNNALDFVPLINQLEAAGVEHPGVFLTSDKSLPRSRATIGRYVEVLDSLLRASSDPPHNEVRWLP